MVNVTGLGQTPLKGGSLTLNSIPLATAIALYGLITAVLSTTLSLFLADAVHVGSFFIGLFFTARAAAGIGVGLATGRLSDRMRDRRVMLGIAGLGGALGALCLALLREYALVFMACVVFSSLGLAAFGQLFGYANEFATVRGRDITVFLSVMRSLFSAAYIVGPPLGIFIMVRYGFFSLYLGVAATSLSLALIGRWGLHRVVLESGPAVPGRRESDGVWHAMCARFSLPARTWLLLGVVLALGIVNEVYSIDIPLHVTKDLGKSPELIGWMLGLTAAIEMPAMVIAGRVASRYGRGRIVGISALLAVACFCLLPSATLPAVLLVLAACNGVWQGAALSIPMVMVQDEVRDGAGTSSALYGAAFGSAGLIAGAATGVTASAVGYGNVFWLCAALSGTAALLMFARFALSRGGGQVPGR